VSKGKLTVLIVSGFLITNIIYAQNKEYRLHPEDVIIVNVYEQPDLTSKVRISREGEVTLPLIGTVNIKGLTVKEAEKKIEKLLAKDYLVNPQVSIFIEQYHSERFSVIGAVCRPGSYELSMDKPITVMEAIALAGGFSPNAAQDRTKIIRMRDNKREVIPIRISDITQKGQKEKDIKVLPGDIIYVPEAFW